MDCTKFTLPTASELEHLISLVLFRYKKDELKEFLDCVEKHRKANLANLEVARKMKCKGVNLAKNIFEYIYVELSMIASTLDASVIQEDLLSRAYQYKRLVQLFDEKE